MRKIFIILAWAFLITTAFAACGPQSDGSYVLCSQIPGIDPQVNNISSYLGGFYRLALMIGGIVVFARIVYGGIKYILAAGSASGQSDARDIITQAIWGLLLLFGAFLILNTISPSLTKLAEPGLQDFDTSPSDFKPETQYRQMTVEELQAQTEAEANDPVRQQRVEDRWQEQKQKTVTEMREEEVNAKYTLSILRAQKEYETNPERIRTLDEEIEITQKYFIKTAENRINSELRDVNEGIKTLEDKRGSPNAGIWGKTSSGIYNLFTSGHFSGLSTNEEEDLDHLYSKREVLNKQIERVNKGIEDY